MLHFLLDENVSPKVAEQLNDKHAEITVHALQTWQQGRYLQAPDDVLLDGVVKALFSLWEAENKSDWTNLTHVLKKS